MARKKDRLPNQSKYLLWLVLLAVILALMGVNLFLRHEKTIKAAHKGISSTAKSENSINYSPSSPQDNAPNNARKSSKSPTETLTANPDASSASLSIKITNASVNDTNLHVGTLVGGANSGTCTLTANKTGHQTTLATSSIKQDVNSYDCGVFNVSTSAFPSSGSWQLVLTVSNGTAQASDSTTVSIPGD